MKLVGVNLHLAQSWTDDQLQAALKAYGGDWKLVDRSIGTRTWEAPDGARAIFVGNSLHIQSKVIVDAVAQKAAERDAKRKQVPKF